MGNREVPQIEAYIEKEGGSPRKPGFPRATEPKAREAAA